MHALAALSSVPRPLYKARWAAVCVFLVIVVAIGDYVTGYEMSLSILYLGPVFIATWTLGRAEGIAFAVISLVAWLVSVEFMGYIYPHPFYQFWEAAIRLVTWVVFAVLLAKLKVALAHADERFVTVLEGMDDAVYVSDTQSGELLYVNEPYRRSFAGGPPLVVEPGKGAEYHDLAARRWYLIRARAIRWVDGRMVRLHIATDATERKLAEEFARSQQEKLQMTARLITAGEMASTLAHELNQPLAAITNYTMGSVRRLRSGRWDADELLDALEKSGAQAERAGRVIQRVREFVRQREPEFTACSINDVIAGVVKMIEIETEKNAVSIKLELAPGLPSVRADKVMVEQVILNLVKNGIEAMQELPQGRRELTIQSGLGASGAVEVAVSDTGRGLPAQLADNLFTPFFTTKPEGMGMGLQICRSIIELHHGRLWAHRNATPGSTFHFSLPIA